MVGKAREEIGDSLCLSLGESVSVGKCRYHYKEAASGPTRGVSWEHSEGFGRLCVVGRRVGEVPSLPCPWSYQSRPVCVSAPAPTSAASPLLRPAPPLMDALGESLPPSSLDWMRLAQGAC